MSASGIEQSLFRVKDNCVSEAEGRLAEETGSSTEAPSRAYKFMLRTLVCNSRRLASTCERFDLFSHAPRRSFLSLSFLSPGVR